MGGEGAVPRCAGMAGPPVASAQSLSPARQLSFVSLSLSLSPCLCVSLSSVSSHLFISPFLLVSASLGKSLWVSCLSFIFKYLCIYFSLLAI